MDEALFRVIYPGLRRFAAIWAPASVEPDDLVQHAAANALARGPLHRLDDPAAYLRSTIANLARNLYRRRNPLPLDTADLSLAVEAAADSYPSDLAELDVLRPHERVALYLVDIERFTHAEAAAILGGSAAAMRARTVRARARLRTSIRDEEGR